MRPDLRSQVGHEEAAPGGDADHGDVAGGRMSGDHLVHHHPGVLGVTHNIEPRTGEAQPGVTSPVEHTAPPASRGRGPHEVADLLS